MARRGQNIAREAKAFCVWREGSAVDWDCTVTELAGATGITRYQVSTICRERGWPVRKGTPGFDRATPIDMTAVVRNLSEGVASGSRHPTDRASSLMRELDHDNEQEELTAA